MVKYILCGDFKGTLNQKIKVDEQPLLYVEKPLCYLQGGQIFSKPDLLQEYQQTPVSEGR